MQTRTLGLVAGMVLVAASSGILQAADMDRKDDTPEILVMMKNNGYKEMSSKEMTSVKGKVIPVVPIVLVGMTYMGVKYIWDRCHKSEYKPFGKW